MKVDTWFLSRGGELQWKRAMLLCALSQKRVVGMVLFEGCMGSAANCSGLRGNCRQMVGALGVRRPRGSVGGAWACQSVARRPMTADRGGKRQ